MISRTRTALLAIVCTLPLTTALAAQTPLPPAPDPVWDSARVAWDEGKYPEALTRLDRMLAGDHAEDYLERAALLTGELYVTTEVASDGRSPRWSPGGPYAAFDVGTGAGRHTIVERLDGERLAPFADVPGAGLVFAPGDGFAAYVVPGMGGGRPPQLRDRALASGAERDLATPGLWVRQLAYGPDGTLYVLAGTPADTVHTQVYALSATLEARRLTDGQGIRSSIAVLANGWVLYSITDRGGVALQDPATGALRSYDGIMPASAPDGSAVVYVAVSRTPAEFALVRVPLVGDTTPVVLLRSSLPLTTPAFSPDGRRLAFGMMPREDWELFVMNATGGGVRRLTHEIQHDLLPQFLTNDVLLEKIGEQRHRRSYLLDVNTGARTRLFHNNTVRTVAPEYAWAPSPDGTKVLIVADRDGNTISPERGVYCTDLSRRVTVANVAARVRVSLAAEQDLRARGQRMFAPIAARVRPAVADVSVSRIDDYAHALFSFDSKFITQPGNALAISYLVQQLRGFGYEPVLQEFEPRPGVRSANVIATLRGTVDPDLTYVASSHFDSVEGGPGADDDASGATALLEAARVLAGRPQPATIQFAFFTAEEAGLRGSREFVRRAGRDSVRIVGALNNDMVGWKNDHRLDNTIRYSNRGLRDLQHAAAFLFTDLITYDSEYYQATDAAAYYEAYGDIVGGIGSYPILGNPHYHQSHDVLETIDQRLVAEVAKTTVASLMLMASSPSRLKGLEVARDGDLAVVTWTAAPERGVTGYRVAYGPQSDPLRTSLAVATPRAVLRGLAPGTRVAVKAVMASALQGWDWARAGVPAQ